MAFSIGDRVGPYEILAPLGAGGMGEVWKARDTRLDRTVAIKVSKTEFNERFEREAHAVAALNHPNICQLYDVGPDYLVMEYVEGTEINGPLPLDQALKYAVQICEALDAAHKKNITHRDLKPANILITKAGIKLLDFGLAKMGPAVKADEATMTMALTGKNEIVGTLLYMSPEQLQNKDADARSDIFSFGLVLYEMLTGKRAFDGGSAASIIAAILERPAPSVSNVAPIALDRALKRCLEKDPEDRWQTARDLKAELEWITSAPELHGTGSASQSAPSRRGKVTGIAATLLAVGVFVASAGWWRATRPLDRPLMRLSVDLGPDAIAGDRITAAISPDGTRLAFLIRGSDGKPQLATRLLDQTTATPLPGTENASDPFFSPDGQWIGFSADQKLKKVAVQGGSVIVLSDLSVPRGASWGSDGNIVTASTRTGLFRIPAAGGAPEPLTKLAESDATNRWPQVLPGSKAVLYTAHTSTANLENARIDVLSLETRKAKTLLQGGYAPRYLSASRSTDNGYLVYIHENVLLGVPFDPVKLELKGTPSPVLDDASGDPITGSGQFDFAASSSGTFIYRSGMKDPGGQVMWVDPAGKTLPLLAKPGGYFTPRFSPDGRKLALALSPSATSMSRADLYIYDWQHDVMSRLTFNGQGNTLPTWMPDGKYIAYSSLGPASNRLLLMRADGAGEAQLLLESKYPVIPGSFSPDGRRLVYSIGGSTAEIWTMLLDLSDPEHPKPGKPELFLGGISGLSPAVLSPDGRWLAYTSVESGRSGVYVRKFPGPGGQWQVSTVDSATPFWSRNTRELFYVHIPDDRIMVTAYTANSDSFMAGRPGVWSPTQIRIPQGSQFPTLDLAPDGKRFAALARSGVTASEDGPVRVTFLLNFLDELRRRVPAGK